MKRTAAVLAIWAALALLPARPARGESASPTAAEWRQMIEHAEQDLLCRLSEAYPEVDGEVLARFQIVRSEANEISDGITWSYDVLYAYDGVRPLTVKLTLQARTGRILHRDPWELDGAIGRYREGIGGEDAARIAREAYAAAFDEIRSERAEAYRAFVERSGEAAARPDSLRAECRFEAAGEDAPFFCVELYSPLDRHLPFRPVWFAVRVNARTGEVMAVEDGAAGTRNYLAPDPFYVAQSAWYWDAWDDVRRQPEREP